MAIVSSDLLTAMNGTSSSSSTTTSSSSLDNNSPDAIQNRFLTLLIAQMKNQDPSNPMDNSQLTTQMAQLSTVTGISQLNNSLSTLMSNLNSSQALSTANMIGHSVLAPGNSIQLTSDTTKDASGTETTSQKAVFGVNLSGTASSVVVTIKDSSGAVVHTTDLGTQAAGVVPVIWDGSNDTGGKVADGNYTFTVSASNNGTAVTASTLSFGTVSSVSTASDGVKLNVTNVGTIKPTDVVQIL
ncbi:flagellar hook assembly protein FlgD [Herbaspirillum huttiense]|jgi:flagellar basal-body rod modification protein FlgD|uniref:Basal-body rod modification protein FlgD n=2 Tax=Herbaspirillum huttiense TaxID=863372 RepID=A0AAJ2H4Y1_9BURK|nr:MULTISPECIES: flagellar hook assembly protein FlgD [Herbaspirillum]MBP1312953.1 flagellar basal-body rod modification protein FlgD [Herbaspirillum sp. 1130]MCO4856803.1 flagellar hook assembly protein FlgD [Herbaspirillum sp. WGmk3]MDR6738189.1 flagellar basal-body rod modification protein FlgD [Herbaspirillum sp. 1173]MDR9834327.1 flagellar hook assembly protein FlgD [Herbaspirillum huttiense]MDT0355739.1 flagellar hook assembly protein FlgD [Herbaspirillum huttiense F1]